MSLVLQSSGGGQITIQEPATASNFTQTLPAADGVTMVSGNMPAFRANRITSNQVIATATVTKVQFNGETFDTNSCFDSTTNYRFTPNVAGYYQLQSCLQTDNFASGYIEIYIYKNGAAISFSNTSPVSPANPSISISDVLFANGSTDYFEIYIRQNSGTNKNIYAGSAPAYCWFSGSMIRGE
jgi:hypothetical protein